MGTDPSRWSRLILVEIVGAKIPDSSSTWFVRAVDRNLFLGGVCRRGGAEGEGSKKRGHPKDELEIFVAARRMNARNLSTVMKNLRF